MKKIFAMLVLGMMLMSSAFAIPYVMKYVCPEFTGDVNNPNLKVLDTYSDVTFVEYNGVTYIIKK